MAMASNILLLVERLCRTASNEIIPYLFIFFSLDCLDSLLPRYIHAPRQHTLHSQPLGVPLANASGSRQRCFQRLQLPSWISVMSWRVIQKIMVFSTTEGTWSVPSRLAPTFLPNEPWCRVSVGLRTRCFKVFKHTPRYPAVQR